LDETTVHRRFHSPITAAALPIMHDAATLLLADRRRSTRDPQLLYQHSPSLIAAAALPDTADNPSLPSHKISA
jgi:hypothetical protein